jgi:methyl-accepting chemotaxis protein
MVVAECDSDSPEHRSFWEKLGHGEFDEGQYERTAEDGRSVRLQGSYNPIFGWNGEACKIVK